MPQEPFVTKLKKNKVFKFLSSVRLAVPLMLVLAAVVAVGTFLEAGYNAQVAGLYIYRTLWFQGLLGLLWINIFCAAVSRWPFKKHHTGFVITHIGLLTLLIGAFITYVYGIDGQLRIVEGESGRSVVLPDLVVKVIAPGEKIPRVYPMGHALRPREAAAFAGGAFERDTGLKLERYLPFVAPIQAMAVSAQPPEAGGPLVKFNLKSQFFNVDQQLDAKTRPEAQMGPAYLRLLVTPKPKESRATLPEGELLVKDNGTEIARIKVSELKRGLVKVRGFELEYMREYHQVAVSEAGLREQPGDQNPALEFNIVQVGKKFREVKFARFPGFAVARVKIPGITFVYKKEIPPRSSANLGPRPSKGNVIEFLLNTKEADRVRLALFKDGAEVLNRFARAGETVQTPWMGITITIQAIDAGNKPQSTETKISDGLNPEGALTPVELQPKMPQLPPGALFIRAPEWPTARGAWIVEGDVKTLKTSRGEYQVYFGSDSIDLPFELDLEHFQKIDYPGTETPMSFQSTVRVTGETQPVEIKMNEPLIKGGYVIYQASYEMGEGVQTASIFSVNRDPGRWVKYIGAIILSVGIIIFTVMRSRWYQKRAGRKS